MLHPQARAALALWSQGPSTADPGFGPAQIEEVRRAARAAAAVAVAAEPPEAVASVEDVDAGGVPCRLYLPDGAGQRPGCVVFLHGGGFVFGDLDTHDPQARRLALRTGLAVLAVGYRRPPEHPFPAAPDDVDAALWWLVTHSRSLGVDPSRLVALGDSAGGNLALVAALRNPGAFARTVLVYPFIDPRRRFASYAATDGGLTEAEAQWAWSTYVEDPALLVHPDVAALDSTELGSLPPTLVLAAEHDVLLDEDVELARRIEAAGGEVSLTTYPGMVHGFWHHPEMFDAAEESLAEVAAFLAPLRE